MAVFQESVLLDIGKMDGNQIVFEGSLWESDGRNFWNVKIGIGSAKHFSSSLIPEYYCLMASVIIAKVEHVAFRSFQVFSKEVIVVIGT